MSWTREAIEQRVERILQDVLGVKPGEFDQELSFARDLMVESLDYVDIGLQLTQNFGIPFDFGEAAERIRKSGVDAIRIRDLVDYLERRLTDA